LALAHESRKMKAWSARPAVEVLGLVLLSGALAGAASAAHAQDLPSRPIAIADGHVTIGGDVSASFGSSDPGFFNYTDYDHSALRMVRVDVSASVKAGDHLELLGDVQTENLDTVRPYALYARIRPWSRHEFDIQVGRVPPTFGAFARRVYVSDNLLIGYPLAYQYLTTLRSDALPADVNELLRKRSTGWHVRYSIGAPTLDRGVPLVSAFRWDTGVQVHAATVTNLVSATVSVTAGSVSDPAFPAEHSGEQLAGRVEVRPAGGLVIGSSLARSPFVDDSAVRSATGGSASSAFTQTAWGGDLEYSRSYYLLRVETIVSAWRIPFANQPDFKGALQAVSTSAEGRYKILPGLYAAGRAEHLGFSDVTGTQGTMPWDAPVTRFEVGGGYSIQRNLLIKLSYQHDSRNGGRLPPNANQVATQLVYWF
jgi:hypothetical protein